MGCCAPNAVGPGPAAADPCKRVNYTLGMLLGVDDFVQESAYHGARRREMARELFGYGTVHGLQVVVEPEDDRGPRVRVMPGMAWLPSGTPVCVDGPQCANLNDWLAAHAAELPPLVSGATLDLYLVLSHAQCLTDNVPIPGEPCRDDSELMQPSRVADGFRLELRLAAPPQREEDAIRDFVAWLLDVPLAASSPPLDEEAFVGQLRAAAHAWLAPTSPPSSPPDYMVGGAPAGTSEQLLSTALRLWTTELRPLWMARADCSCSAEPIAPKDDAVLLAELAVRVIPGSPLWQVSSAAGAVQQDERRRPYVLSLRMLQELITLHPVPDPAEGVEAETTFAQAAKVGVSLHYARADHTHGTPPLPALAGDVLGAVGANEIDKLHGAKLVKPASMVNGHVLTVQGGEWVAQALPAPPPPVLNGDVVGAVGSTRVDKLQGATLLAPGPLVNGQVLTVQGGQWVPAALPPAPTAPPVPALGGDLSGTIGTARVASLQGVTLVTPSTLTNGHVLTVEAGQWKPKALPPPPPAPSPAPIPALLGDVTGTIGDNTITSLQKVPVVAPSPSGGDVLFFDGANWIPKAVTGSANVQAVTRGNELPYEILAAAEVTFRPGATAVKPIVFDHMYGKVTLDKVDQPTGSTARIEFLVEAPDAEKFTGFDVKLTPIFVNGEFRLYLAARVKPESGTSLRIAVLLTSDIEIKQNSSQYAFQMEISRYAEKLQ